MKLFKKYNRKEMTDKILSLPKVNLGKNWMEEIDTIEHKDMIRRNKKSNKHVIKTIQYFN